MAADQSQALIDGLFGFLSASPTPFHATRNAVRKLQDAGFELISEADPWQLQPGGRYIVTRNGSAVVAFALGTGDVAAEGLHMAGAHTDSPCLKVKPNPELLRTGCFQLGVEVYGGVLLNPWFDRDLSLAGRVSYLDRQGQVGHTLIDFQRPIAVIPSLAIHLDRGVNDNRSVNAQLHLPPVMMSGADGVPVSFRDLLMEQLQIEQADLGAIEILDYELAFYDTQPPARVGLRGEYITSARLDNLLSCYVGLQALINSDGSRSAMLALTDHEEVGSSSVAGAHGTLMESILRRIAGDHERYARMIDRSLMISCDNAHAIHPNYAERHDAGHGPLLNHGPVIKVNANQRYATTSETAAIFRRFCRDVDAPVQSFVVRSDMGCGSTIGPVAATELGVRTVDVGVPQWAMHSIRELAGSEDFVHLYRVLSAFYRFL